MWLITTIGFFSVVSKPREAELTVRARTEGDLEALLKLYLPTLGPIEVGTGTDYPYRARVSAKDFADALGQMIQDIDYANFKDAVADRQGLQRAHTYGRVWSALRELTQEGES